PPADGTRITVRDCSNDDWGHHCGDIRFMHGEEEQMIYGCLEACARDGCNSAKTLRPPTPLILLATSLLFLASRLWRTLLS
ncbi:uncharacterized protein LOC131954219, partial [Physella acuta]|uniref:uncharacterized protein LOC131954219 n=1 Tax=Physella acuta TaxID=109671 RepID=UPI0027DBE024